MDQIETNISGGQNQILPSVTQAVQNNYYGMPSQLPSNEVYKRSDTVFILGAGVEAVLGIPTSASLIPNIVDYIETEEGKQIDAALRKAIGGVRFHFSTFVNNTIDKLAKDLDPQIDTIIHDVEEELRVNANIDEAQRKMGNLIVRLFSKIRDVKNGAAIDEETSLLIEEVIGAPVRDEAIIDFRHLNYTDTFKTIIVEILQKSMHESSNPILRHVYKNILDIEQLLAQYFYGFYSGMPSYIRTYLYISWMLWAYLVHEEQRVRKEKTELLEDASEFVDKDGLIEQRIVSIYKQLANSDFTTITFNYTSFARELSETSLYFNGNLMQYVDIENKNEFTIEDIDTIDILDFVQNRLKDELSLSGDRKAIPIPSFLPPLKLKPVISSRYIDTWYKASEFLRGASKILVLGYSFTTPDDYFCEMLRQSRNAHIIIINNDLDNVARNVCRVFQLPNNRYTRQLIDGIEHRTYDNRIEIIAADLATINIAELLDKE